MIHWVEAESTEIKFAVSLYNVSCKVKVQNEQYFTISQYEGPSKSSVMH